MDIFKDAVAVLRNGINGNLEGMEWREILGSPARAMAIKAG